MSASAAQIPSDTIERQHRASHPGTSAWVSANAGSGKTHVLAQRVLRLLLAGVPPARILCLTFTKAAAANMSIRVFSDLARWTRLDDAALRARHRETGAPVPALPAAPRRSTRRAGSSPARSRRRAASRSRPSTPSASGCCISFPFEANVPARFEVLDERRGRAICCCARPRDRSGGGRAGARDDRSAAASRR